MIQQLRQDLKAEPVPVVLGELIPGHGQHDAINAVLPQAVKQTPHSALASAAGLGNKALHFNSADLRTLGKRYAAEYLKLTKP
jgi:hypothetical protein